MVYKWDNSNPRFKETPVAHYVPPVPTPVYVSYSNYKLNNRSQVKTVRAIDPTYRIILTLAKAKEVLKLDPSVKIDVKYLKLRMRSSYGIYTDEDYSASGLLIDNKPIICVAQYEDNCFSYDESKDCIKADFRIMPYKNSSVDKSIVLSYDDGNGTKIEKVLQDPWTFKPELFKPGAILSYNINNDEEQYPNSLIYTVPTDGTYEALRQPCTVVNYADQTTIKW